MKGKHMMANGKMMKDSEMKAMMESGTKKGKKGPAKKGSSKKMKGY